MLATAGGSVSPQKQEVAIQEAAKLAGVNPPLLRAAQTSRSFRTLHKAEVAIGLLAVQILAGATLQQVHRQINALDGRTKANSNLAGSKDAVDATVAASVVVGTAAVALVLAHQAAAPPRVDVAAAAVAAIASLAVATPVNSAAAATTTPVPIAAGVRATILMDANGTGSNSR
mmetsp:Transcript_59581/g.123317  ORF Transcript_59581/g.123317 Transcript_59581/m.123317 type:complete len:173 (+) Transcript_59581:3-521(+)